MSITLRNSVQSFPMHRDLKTLTALFHEEAADLATWYDISSEKRKLETGIFSIVYPNLHKWKFEFLQPN